MNFLGFPDWQIIEITEEITHFFIRARYEPTELRFCALCRTDGRFLRKFGNRIRCLKDAPVRGKKVSIVLTVQRYKCLCCRRTFLDEVPEIAGNMKFTRRLVAYIEEQAVSKNFQMVADETGVSENTVRNIFVRFVERIYPRLLRETPTVLGIDEVYIDRVARCILTNIKKKEIFDILPKRDKFTVFRYLCQMKNKERVKIVTMDMWRPFYTVIKKAFPDAEVVIDKFHVQRMANQAVNIFLRNLRNCFNSTQRRHFIHDRFILMKRSYNLTEKEKMILLRWRRKLPILREMYRLKEEFVQIWQNSDRRKAEELYKYWKESIPPELEFAFEDILTAVGNWHQEIFNYFDYRVTNAFTESANNLIKSVQKRGRGCSFEIVRAKMLCQVYLKSANQDNDAITTDYQAEQGRGVRKKKLTRIKRLKLLRESGDLLIKKVRGLKTWQERLQPHLIYIDKDD